jgi:hypothetical protein
MLSTSLWQHTKMSTTLKTLDGLKDFECEKGQLSSRPPVPYVPLRDLITTKEAPESLKIKLPDGSVFNMSIYSCGIIKEYLAHVITVLHLIRQKGLNPQCRKLGKAVVKLSGTLKNPLKDDGSKTTVLLDVDVESRKVETEQTQQILQETQKTQDEAIAKTYKLLRNLLTGDVQTRLDHVCRKMHEHDWWAGVNCKVTK